ncbi:MAG: riboflavin synthase, partial [Patescibacteria group bacterium]
MYSGIIRHRGTVIDRNDLQDGGAIFRFSAPSDILERLKLGSSINVAGVCLTVVKKDAESFSTDVMPQTLRLSTAMDWSVGTPVNLESSLRLGEELGGHLIFGHVDGVATIVDDRKDGNARLLT